MFTQTQLKTIKTQIHLNASCLFFSSTISCQDKICFISFRKYHSN
ncbi:hypothetical protein Hsw_3034 [Hymenobacter swuensis DY53]|uniref:Uncharacterized protein n=1 Tax=Hymenobacter swuensis DY53 TaxID=1227739 RepID=W8EZU3_9BACT|nr:hypothetical protein Hsw_3034 [Hymenobacter swuensis DY53]